MNLELLVWLRQVVFTMFGLVTAPALVLVLFWRDSDMPGNLARTATITALVYWSLLEFGGWEPELAGTVSAGVISIAIMAFKVAIADDFASRVVMRVAMWTLTLVLIDGGALMVANTGIHVGIWQASLLALLFSGGLIPTQALWAEVNREPVSIR